MFSTVVAAVSILVLVLPGFVIVDLQRRRRASVAVASDWELVLRALSYSVVLHLAVSWWTASLAAKLDHARATDLVWAVVPYGVVVLVVVPTIAGLGLGWVLLRAERSGEPLKWWHYALGGRDARGAWDFIFQRMGTGRWVVLRLRSGRAIAGHLGSGSWSSQSPAAGGHDLWLQEAWSVDDAGQPGMALRPRQGMWVARDEIAALFVIDPPPATMGQR